jgi:hypothetical protein
MGIAMNDQQRRDLTDLRAAAQERNQERVQYLLKRLLQSMDYFVALSVPLERLQLFLDIFESYYPEEIWIRKLLLTINTFGTPPESAIAEAALQETFSAPGAANFVKAVFDLTQAMQDKHTGEARIGYMASAVVNGIMAELAEAWYGEREADWQRVRSNQYDPQTGTYSDPEAMQIAYTFWTDEATAMLDQSCWMEIAANIEKKLLRYARTPS